VLCALLPLRGGWFTIENPAVSLLFRSSPMQGLGSLLSVWSVTFDQCMYGLRPPAAGPEEYIKESTRVVANFPAISGLERRCTGRTWDHLHVHALGTRRTSVDGTECCVSVAMWASRYPDGLCRALAELAHRQISEHAVEALRRTAMSA
jgi:hypothetical protein